MHPLWRESCVQTLPMRLAKRNTIRGRRSFIMSKARTPDEVKKDIRDRIGRRAPFLHADQTEAEEALEKMTTFEGETWAAAWNDLGARWEEKANAAEKARNSAQAQAAFLKSYGYYGIARHPFPSTPGKIHGYRKTREMFLAASKYFDRSEERRVGKECRSRGTTEH